MAVTVQSHLLNERVIYSQGISGAPNTSYDAYVSYDRSLLHQ